MQRFTSSDFDRDIGQKIKILRLAKGLTIRELATKMAISYQQIHKYETAKNRIPASRLIKIANILNTPINYFYKDYQTTPSSNTNYVAILNLLENLSNIKDTEQRQALSKLIKTMAKN